jgi:hypothetical protein
MHPYHRNDFNVFIYYYLKFAMILIFCSYIRIMIHYYLKNYD